MSISITRRALSFVAFSFVFAAAIPEAPAQESKIREFRGRTMGTTYMVKVAGADSASDDDLRFKVDAELRKVNDQMSTYLESSEISAFNQSRTTDWFEVSPEFAEVVSFAQQVSEKTEGAFDITIAPLVDAWSFGSAERTNQVPSEESLSSLRQRVGYTQLSVRSEPPALRKSLPDLTIDLSSIAKGHGVDRVIELLQSMGVENAFVEVGGEVRTIGAKPDAAWRVGIQLPDAKRDTLLVAHAMEGDSPAGNSMATSGDYRNFFVANGKRYSHTIDPRTGSPVSHELASVTVIAPTCMEADAWATAISVLGPEDGLALAQRETLDTLLVSRTIEGETAGYEKHGTGVLSQYALPAEIDKTAGAEPEEPGMLAAVIPMALVSFVVFGILISAMAVGVMFGRKSISGSCGGLANQTNPDGSSSCALCSNPSDACRELREKMADAKEV